jgi:hypothetical protein
MSTILRTGLTVAAAIAVVLAFVAGPALFRSDDETPQVTPKPGIRTRALQLRFVPDVPTNRRRATRDEIAAMLERLYTSAFVQPAATPPPDQSPRPQPTRRIATLLTKQARVALAKRPQAFDEANDLALYSGGVAFQGLVVFSGGRPVESFLDIDFKGVATPVGRSSPVADVRQTGKVVLKRTANGWFVDGFDLKLTTRPQPTPEPSPS